MDGVRRAYGTMAQQYIELFGSSAHVDTDDLALLVRGATLVVGFFEGGELQTFEHKVVTAYYWPVDELSARLRLAGFTVIRRQLRPGTTEFGRRSHAAIVAIAS